MADIKDTEVITLKYPIPVVHEGVESEIKEIKLHRMKLKHLKLLPEQLFASVEGGEKANIGPKDIIPILRAMTGMDEDTIGEIDLEDMVNAADTISDFVECSLAAIGKT